MKGKLSYSSISSTYSLYIIDLANLKSPRSKIHLQIVVVVACLPEFVVVTTTTTTAVVTIFRADLASLSNQVPFASVVVPLL